MSTFDKPASVTKHNRGKLRIAACLIGLAAMAAFPLRLVAGESPDAPAGADSGETKIETGRDGQIRGVISQLASPDAGVRGRALDALVKTRDGRLADLMDSYFQGSLYLWKGQPVVGETVLSDEKGKRAALYDPLTFQPLTQGGQPLVVHLRDLKEIEAPRSERKAVAEAGRALALWSDNLDKRVLAIKAAGDQGVVGELPALEEIARSDPSSKIRHTARESIDLIEFKGDFPSGVAVDRLAAARDLGAIHSARGRDALTDSLAQIEQGAAGDTIPSDAAAQAIYRRSIAQIDRYQRFVAVFNFLKEGVSRGSILILMALGLAVTFGLMGVINMAHGELMMIGAFTTLVVERWFAGGCPPFHVSPAHFDWFYAVSLPASFLVAGCCGYLIEKLVVRHLYGRPLETLLATFGVSLILIQAVQTIFLYNVRVSTPTWLQGSMQVMPDMDLPYNRCFVVLLCVCCVLLFYLIMNYTRYGLQVRATTQNRDMAAALGVNTRRIDGLTFALGSGLAGLAGCGLTQIGGVSPDMGQNYIVESFLVVVTGGVGELAGTVYAGLGLGLLNKIFEPFFGAVWGMVLLLVAIVLFIQLRPAGLFPPKGRQADV